MSAATKRKHVTREVEAGLVLPNADQLVARVVAGRGNNLHEVTGPDGDAFLVSMPTKFRKNVWIKRGGFVVVTRISEGDKVKGEIAAVLYPDSVAHIRAAGLWPTAFNDHVAPVPPKEKSDGPNAAYDLGDDLFPPSESESEGEEDDEDGYTPATYQNPNHTRGIFAAPQALRVARLGLRGIHTQTVSFIDYANDHKAMASSVKRTPEDYSCGPELYGQNLWTYYQIEKSMEAQRMPQPTAGVPDTPRETNPPPPPKAKK